jgi:dipeptidyl-peptidase-4
MLVMKRLLPFFLLIITHNLIAQLPITLEDIWQNGTFSAKGVPGFNFRKDGEHYTKRSGPALIRYALQTGEIKDTLFDARNIAGGTTSWKGNFDGFAFDQAEKQLLLTCNTQPIYRYSSMASSYVYHLSLKKLTELHDGKPVRDPVFSPDARKVSYSYQNNLYITHLDTGKRDTLTTDGKINHIINGAGDWVYEEEFELVRAYAWSPDNKKLAFIRFDEQAVREMSMEQFVNQAYPQEQRFKYPKVGEKNASVSVWVYNLTDKTISEVETGAEPEDYLPRITWTPTGSLCITRLNRLQNHLQILICPDTVPYKCQSLYSESNERYIDLHDVYFLKNSTEFIIQSEQSGFNHLYRCDSKGKKYQITRGKWDVTDFYGIDETSQTLFFQAANRSPLSRNICSINLNGKNQKSLHHAEGYHSAQFNTTLTHFIHTYSSLNTPPIYEVCHRNGKVLRNLENNAYLREKMTQYQTAPAHFFNFNNRQKIKLHGFMIKPTKPDSPDVRLPLLLFVYGGPGSQQVLNQWKGANFWWFQMLAQMGFAVACVDNRGTGARGEEFKKCTYKQLGKLETQDQVDAAKYLGSLSFIDPKRIGIFGWSYGGYMSTLCLLKGAEVFKAAIAVAPVTNWKWYDSVYTERYMQTYHLNPSGYEENAPVNFADQLQGNYLIIHGLTDDNVHFQHTAEMCNKLIAANKQFDTMIYPNKNHGISGGNTRLHLYTLINKFLQEKLKD